MTSKEYLTNHSLEPEFVKEQLGWRWDEKKITIPIYDNKGNHLYSRYRWLGTSSNQPKFTTDTGSHPVLYCSHKIKKAKTVVFTEGEPDAARLWQEGIPAVTGTSGVKTFSPKLASPLKGKEVTICLDNDEAGHSSIEQYYNILTEAGAIAKIKQLPENFKDISDYFTAGYSKEDFEELGEHDIGEWKDSNLPEEFKWEEGPDLLKRDLPPEEWLVDRILPTEGFAFIIGPEATGKSFYTLTLAESITTGKPWIGEFKVNKKEKVLIIDKENTKRRTQSRLQGLGMTGENIFWLKYPHFFELADSSSKDGFSKIVKSASCKVKKEGIKVVMIDSFTDVMVGNENVAGDVQGFFDAFRQLFPGCLMLVLHHASKPAQGVTRTSAQRARGSTNIMAQVYSALFVEALPKSKNEFTMEQTKSGDAEKLNKFLVKLDIQDIPHTNKTKIAGILYKGEVFDQDLKTQKAITIIEDAFKATVSIPRQELLDYVVSKDVSQATMERAIKEMKENKSIESVEDENNRAKRVYVYLGEKGKDSSVYYEE